VDIVTDMVVDPDARRKVAQEKLLIAPCLKVAMQYNKQV
jgi:hypothetical protein